MPGCVLTDLEGGRPHWGNCLESRTLSNKHSAVIIKKDASWGSLLRLHKKAGMMMVWGVDPIDSDCFSPRGAMFLTRDPLVT